jgi:hypothetical protein
MSTIAELWKHAKGDLHKEASKAEMILHGAKKLLPAAAGETQALSKMESGLGAVRANIDERRRVSAASSSRRLRSPAPPSDSVQKRRRRQAR